MLAELKFSDVRAQLTDVVDNALRNRPTVIKARKASEAPSIIMSLQMMNDLIVESMSGPKFKVDFVNEADGSVVATLDPFEVVVTGDTKEAAIENLVDEVMEYVKEYMDEFSLYRNSKNRRNHFPLVFRILACDTREQIKDIIGIA